LALTILNLCIEVGDKVLIFRYVFFVLLLEIIKGNLPFSQSLLSLNKLEEFLSQCYIPNTDQKWEKNINYYSKLEEYNHKDFIRLEWISFDS
jgi:hypothetical protein